MSGSIGKRLESISIDRFHVQAVLHQEKGTQPDARTRHSRPVLQNAIVRRVARIEHTD